MSIDQGTLTKEILVEAINAKLAFPVKNSKEILEMVLEEIKSTLEKGEDVKISGFGKWSVNEKRARPGRNPHTGEKIEIAPRRVVTFHAADTMRNAVNRQGDLPVSDK